MYVKTVASDHSYVDFKADRVGVRVRKNLCRPIILERGRWTEYGVHYSIPVEYRELRAQKTGFSSLASNVTRVEEAASGSQNPAELRQVILGEIGFEDTVSTGI